MKKLAMLLLALYSINSVCQIDFIPNKGQFIDFDGKTHPEIYYKVEAPGCQFFFKDDGIFMQFSKVEEKTTADYTQEDFKSLEEGNLGAIGHKVYFYQMNVDFIGANEDVVIESAGQLSSMNRNYYLEHCPDGILDVKASSEIIYKNLYPNIDLRYYSKNGYLKYDFIVHPGADPSMIKMKYQGYDDISMNDKGITINNPVTTFNDASPIAFLTNNTEIPVQFILDENGIVSFDLGLNAITETVIIDPTFEWGTFFGGTSSATWTRPVFDSNDGMYNAGYTYEASFPVLNAGAGQYFDAAHDGITDLVVTKFNADHSQAWATYYGGDEGDYLAGSTDYGKAIAINDNDEIYVAGQVQSGTNTFPTYDPGSGNWYQDDSHIYGETAFILKFNASGQRLWASMFQHENGASTSSEGIRINGITTDGTRLYITGQLYNWNGSGIPLRTLAGAYNNPTYVGDQDPWIGRFDGTDDLEWCTYFNGGNALNQAYGQGVDLHVDGAGNLWFIGRESIGDPGSHYLLNPGGGAYYQGTNGGSQDILFAKFNSSMAVVYSTYYGGSDQDIPSMITTDANDNPLIVCRWIKSTNLPTTNPGGGAYYQSTLGGAGNTDGAIMKFDNNANVIWATYVGGTGSTNYLTGIGADPSNGDIYVSGNTNSTDFPTLNEAGSYYDGTNGGSADAVFMKFSDLGVLEWSTYFGGSNNESLYSGKGAVLNGTCGVDFVAYGITSSADISFQDPGGGAYFQNTGGANNTYIFYFAGTGGSASVAPSAVTGTNTICAGNSTTLTQSGGSLDGTDDYVWYTGSCGGTQVGTGSSIVVNPSVTTDYFVRVEGPCGNTSCATVTVTVNPQADASWTSPGTVCEGAGTVDLDALITGDAGGSWTGTGVTGSTFDPSGLNGQSITVTYTLGGSCPDASAQSISVESSVSAAWTSPSTGICESASPLDLNTLVTGSAGGSWSGTGVTGSNFDPTGLSGNISITYSVGSGSCTDMLSQDIEVLAAPATPSISANDSTICAGETITIDGNGSGAGVTYNIYDSSSGGTLLGTTPYAVSPGTTTTYYIEAVNADNCTHVGTRPDLLITVNPLPSLTVSPDETICLGETVNLSATGSGNLVWSTSETTANISVSPTTSTDYSVTLTDANNCESSATITVTVSTSTSVSAVDDLATTDPGTVVNIDVLANDNENGSSVTIISTPENGVASILSDGTVDYIPLSGYTGEDSLTYQICDAFCVTLCDTAMVRITIQTEEELIVPGGFSPNGDGINETFVIGGLDAYPNNTLTIFNRWGDIVYSAEPYNNDWDGSSTGNGVITGTEVVTGTYFYILILDEETTLNGYIEIKK